jgi:L-ascorbate metabolism protein UlaG (beta-lactamase superfamily)
MDKLYQYRKGKFISKYDGFNNLSLKDILKWKLFNRAKRRVESYSPKIDNQIDKMGNSADYISWMGHSTFIINIGGKRVMTDPVFGSVPLHKRRVQFPYKIEELPHIDYILISHAHYDHLDINSIKTLSKFKPKVIVPLGISRYLKGVSDIEIIELEWFQALKENEIEITLLPAKHWSRRGAFDLNRTLWGSFLINSIYFAGDTSYSDHFRMVGEKYSIKIALMPIGAYQPEYIMKHNHINPEEALRGSFDLNAEITIPMHYGTFKLSDEDIDEPIQWFHSRAKETQQKVKELNIGEVWLLA